jgi:hypothetical protein
MKYTTLIFIASIVLYIAADVQGQSALDTTFLLPNAYQTTIAALTVDHDTIVCYGDITDNHLHYGAYISKFDTLGRLLKYTTLLDSNRVRLNNEKSGLIITEDSGYAALSSLQTSDTVFLIKFDHELNLLWESPIWRQDQSVIFADGLVQSEGKYYIAGIYWNGNAKVAGFVACIDSNGNPLWNKNYPSPTGRSGFTSIINGTNSNSLWVCGVHSIQTITGEIIGGNNWLIEIDTIGNVKQNWTSANDPYEGRGVVVEVNNFGEIVYSGTRITYSTAWSDTMQLMLKKVNVPTSQTVWTHLQTSLNLYPPSSWYDAKKNPATHGYDMVGSQYVISSQENVQSGVAAHCDSNGILQWIRRDTQYYNLDESVNRNELFTLGHLSSGSIIAGGLVDKAFPQHHREAWLIKYTLDGCVEVNDCAPVEINEVSPGTINVFPNPFRDFVNIDYTGNERIILVQVYNQYGQLVSQDSFNEATRNLALHGLENGVYYLKLTTFYGDVHAIKMLKIE